MRGVSPGSFSAILVMAMVGSSLGDASPPELRPFLEAHCFSCHGPDEQEGDLRLDTLTAPTRGNGATERWHEVFDAVDSGDMPPKKKARPEPAAKEGFLRHLAGALAAATDPPLALRRMNRTEYEHTVQDLLGIDTPLADLLPEDSSVQGFDKVGDGLTISSILMERYLEAADTAFESVIRRIPPLPESTRRAVFMEFKENIDSVKGAKGGVLEVEGSFVKFTPGWPPARLDDAHPIEDGVYRCRFAVWPYQPRERTLAVAVYVGPLFGPAKRRFMGMFDVTGTAREPRIVEFTTRMKEGDALHIVPWVYPQHVTWRDKEEPRPGIALAWAETHGPLDQSFPSEAQKRLFGDAPTLSMAEGDPLWMRHRKGMKLHHVDSAAPREDAERIIRSFVPRAFRRPVDEVLVNQFVTLTLDRLDAGRTFEQAVRAGITAVLCSPHFLLLNREPTVDDHTLASRLSYFLWSTLPDEELLGLAAAGKLRDPKILHAQVERMLRDARSERFTDSFTGQWLDLRRIAFTTPDAQLYPEFDELLQESMLGETRGFFRHLLEMDLGVRHFIDSRFTVLNERLANHYGIPGVKGHERFQLVSLPEDSPRGGVLTQASVLKVTANGTTTSPVLRGVWILDRILGQPAPPPPPGVPAVEPDIRGATSIREQLDLHASEASCARCHARIDPPGFALEGFDVIGGFRDRYRTLGTGEPPPDPKVRSYRLGLPVEADAEGSGGGAAAAFVAFRSQLLADEDRFARAIAEKLLVYGTGRRIGAAERDAVDAVLDAARANDLGLRSLIHAVVASDLFHEP